MGLKDAFRAYRQQAGKSQEEVARALGLAPSRISDIERGRRNVKFEEVARFADFLGMSTEDWNRLRGLIA